MLRIFLVIGLVLSLAIPSFGQTTITQAPRVTAPLGTLRSRMMDAPIPGTSFRAVQGIYLVGGTEVSVYLLPSTVAQNLGLVFNRAPIQCTDTQLEVHQLSSSYWYFRTPNNPTILFGFPNRILDFCTFIQAWNQLHGLLVGQKLPVLDTIPAVVGTIR